MKTFDAIGCQKNIAEKIVKDKKADYILNLKDNQPSTKKAAEFLFQHIDKDDKNYSCTSVSSTEKGHSGIETRSCLRPYVVKHFYLSRWHF